MSFALTYPNILSVTLDPAAEYIELASFSLQYIVSYGHIVRDFQLCVLFNIAKQ